MVKEEPLTRLKELFSDEILSKFEVCEATDPTNREIEKYGMYLKDLDEIIRESKVNSFILADILIDNSKKKLKQGNYSEANQCLNRAIYILDGCKDGNMSEL